MTKLSMEPCRICSEPSRFLWSAQVLDHTVSYFECPSCAYIQTEKPYWLDKAYNEAINLSDTGMMQRNITNHKVIISVLLLLGGLSKRVVDFAGGFGILVRLLRDTGVDALHSDPYCQNLTAKGFEHQGEGGFLVTAFEAFEHFEDPSAELMRMLAVAPNVLLSTKLAPSPTPSLEDWWYYAPHHGQHIGIMREAALQHLASKHGKQLTSDGQNYHLISDRKYPKVLWQSLIRYSVVIAWFGRFGLKSRTWSDHLRFRDDL